MSLKSKVSRVSKSHKQSLPPSEELVQRCAHGLDHESSQSERVAVVQTSFVYVPSLCAKY